MKNEKIILPVIAVLFLVGLIYFNSSKNNSVNLQSQENNEGGVSVEVAPVASFDKPLQFEVKFTAHQGDLDFDLAKAAVLIDEKNNQYSVASWTGGSGGHHLSGVLTFPFVLRKAKTIKLVIKDIYNIPKREFLWSLK